MIAWAIETLIATTLLMLLVLLLREPVRRALGPGMAYALWLLPLARFLLPPLPQGWREQAAPSVAAAGKVITYYVIGPLAEAPAAVAVPAQPAFDWLTLGISIWGMGAALFLGWHLLAHARYCARLLGHSRSMRTVAQGRVRVIESDAAQGPLAFGIWRKYVAFPRDFGTRYDAVERDLALAHELGHHARGDLIANWAALVVLALHWFNPIAWRAFRAFRADQEMACDALVLAGRPVALRHAYGRAIVKSAHGGAVSAACHLHTINDVKGRLRMLTRTQTASRRRSVLGGAGLAVLSVAGLAFTASGTQAAERLRGHVGSRLGAELASLQVAPVVPEAPSVTDVPPAPPVPPEPPAAAGDGKQSRQVVIVRMETNSTERIDTTTSPTLAAIEVQLPEARDGKCGIGDPAAKDMVARSNDGGKRRTVICVDRIEAQTKGAEALAMQSKRLGLTGARLGLTHARAAIEGNPGLTPEQRAEALRGIDQAIAGFDKNNPAD